MNNWEDQITCLATSIVLTQEQKNGISQVLESNGIALAHVLQKLEQKPSSRDRIAALLALQTLISSLSAVELDVIFKIIAKLVSVPKINYVWSDDVYSKNKPEYVLQESFKEVSVYGLAVLKELLNIDSHRTDIIKIFSQFSIETPWCDEKHIEIANIVPIDQEISELIDIIRPIFNKLASSRKIVNPIFEKIKFRLNVEEDHRTEWHENELYSVSVLNYVVEHNKNFELISFCINVIDDHELPIKIMGCEILEKLVGGLDRTRLKNSGMIKVLEELLSKNFTYLPPLVPIDYSVALLKISFKTVCELYELGEDKQQYVGILNSVLSSIISISENVRILMVLLGFLDILIDRMGVSILNGINRILFHLLNLLTNPLILESEDLTIRALEVLNNIIRTCWVRIDRYKYDIIGGLVVLYKNRKTEMPLIIDNLRLLHGAVDIEKELRELVKRDSGLQELVETALQ